MVQSSVTEGAMMLSVSLAAMRGDLDNHRYLQKQKEYIYVVLVTELHILQNKISIWKWILEITTSKYKAK